MNIIAEVFGDDFIKENNPSDFTATAYYIMHTELDEREIQFLYWYYNEGQSLGEVSGKANLSRERVRQVLAASMEKIRAKENILRVGLKESFEKELEAKCREANLKGADRANAVIRNIKAELNNLNALIEDNSGTNALMDIHSLELSARTYNALCRAGIYTVENLMSMSIEELKGLKNFGATCEAEIVNKLARYGITLRRGEKR